MLPTGSKRGLGTCPQCKTQYANRSKPKNCSHCHFELGGSYIPKKTVLSPPASVVIYQSNEQGCLRSVMVSQANHRNFVFIKNNEKICYVRRCLDLRTACIASNAYSQFTCKHINNKAEDAIYSVRFSKNEIRDFTPDVYTQNEMWEMQSSFDCIPTVVKVSEKSYATFGPVTTTSPMGYVHVLYKTDDQLSCSGNNCKKKIGKTKQMTTKHVCLHIHYVLLARRLKEKLESAQERHDEDSTGQDIPVNKLRTIEILKKKMIPYKIPPSIVSKSNHLQCSVNDYFYPEESHCSLCGHMLSEPMFQQGCSSKGGNGYLITNMNPFLKINIQQKKCLNKDCKSSTVVFPYKLGLFNACNKVLVGLDIMLEWRSYMKRGGPVSTAINAKLESLLCKIEQTEQPSHEILEYLSSILYNGFYGFEVMTVRDLNDVICGYCGIVGQVYFGDGNEKNCCSLKEVSLHPNETFNDTPMELQNGDWFTSFFDKIKTHILEKAIYASSKLSFQVDYDKIPPLIPSMQRKCELNSESEKKSTYTDKNSMKFPGDSMILSKLIRSGKLSLKDIDDMVSENLLSVAKECKIHTSGKSMDRLRADIRQLYGTILSGISSCHEFCKLPGHSGGFYHLVCSHGTTVCSKFMILTESVRDAADLWLSLKHPPSLFICDTPCTFVQHINHREPEIAQEYWGCFDGCFEEPSLVKLPANGIDAPSITPAEFQKNDKLKLQCSHYVHPLTGNKRRYVCGDRFHSKENPHKSPLCRFHNIDLCLQATTVKTSYQESLNNRKNKARNKSSCSQEFLHHFVYNYLMNYYENEEVVEQQKRNIEAATKKTVHRDEFMKFVFT